MHDWATEDILRQEGANSCSHLYEREKHFLRISLLQHFSHELVTEYCSYQWLPQTCSESCLKYCTSNDQSGSLSGWGQTISLVWWGPDSDSLSDFCLRCGNMQGKTELNRFLKKREKEKKRALGCGPNSGHITKALLPRGIWYKTNCQPFSLLSVLA